MKTSRQHHTENSSVRLNNAEQDKQNLISVRSLPAVRPFSNVAVQRKTVSNFDRHNETDNVVPFTRFTTRPAAITYQPPVQGGFFSSFKEKIFGKSKENTGDVEMDTIHDTSGLHEVAPGDDYFKPDAQNAKGYFPGKQTRVMDLVNSGTGAIAGGYSSVKNRVQSDGILGATKYGLGAGLGKMKTAGASALNAVQSGGNWLFNKGKSAVNSIGAGASWFKNRAASHGIKNAFSSGASILWGRAKSGLGSAKTSMTNLIGNKDKKENIDRINLGVGSVLPGIQSAMSIRDAVNVSKTGGLDQKASLAGGLGGIASGAITGGLGAREVYAGLSGKNKDYRRALLGASDTVGGALSIASGGMSIAGVTGAAIPGLGAAAAGLDTVTQGAKAYYAHRQRNQLKMLYSKIANNSEHGDLFKNDPAGSLTKGEGYTGDMKKQYELLKIAREAAKVREKQRNRSAVNALGSGIETAGHATVAGAGATGIGAIVGMSLIAGGKGIKAISSLVRNAKQAAIDKGWMGKGEADERTTKNKDATAKEFVENVMKNYADPNVQEAMELMGANKEQIDLLKEGQLPAQEIYKLYKAR